MATDVKVNRRENGSSPARRNLEGGGVVEALTAAAGIALAIIGLAGAAPRFLDTIAVIVLGASFLFERWTATTGEREGIVSGAEFKRGMTFESIAGWAGVVLGILSLLRLAPTVLAPIAVIAFGAGLLLGLRMWRGGRGVAGVAAIVLGILALVQIDPRTLTLIGLLAVGSALLLSGSAIGMRARHPVAA